MLNLKSIIESILFLRGEPASLSFLAKVTGKKEPEILSVLNDLTEEFKERGIRLIKKNDEYQFGTAPENAEILDKMVKSEFSEELSKAALETLTIVSYKGPLTRIDIEHVRGVNSSFTLRNLLMRGLIERIENPKDARSYLYRVSFDTLKYLGLSKVEDLPDFQAFKDKKIEILENIDEK